MIRTMIWLRDRVLDHELRTRRIVARPALVRYTRSDMPCYICETCGTQHAVSAAPPARCVVCEDDRQYVSWNGQTWTTHEALAARYRLRVEDDGGLLGIAIAPDFAIPQRALLLPTDAGNLLWECVSLVTDEAVAALKERGGVDRIVISHPHFYSSMVEWSDALGGVPILLHEADQEWVLRSSPAIEYWSGDVNRSRMPSR